MTRLVLWVLTILCVARVAYAREVVLRLSDPSGAAPSHLCIASLTNDDLSPAEKRVSNLSDGLSLKAGADRQADGWTGDGLVEALEGGEPAAAKSCGTWTQKTGSVDSRAECPLPNALGGACAFRVGSGVLGNNEKLSCRANEMPSLVQGKHGVLVLLLRGWSVSRIRLQGNLARIQAKPPAADSQAPVLVAGGHYREGAEVPVLDFRGTEVIELVLTPRCREHVFHRPAFECRDDEHSEHVVVSAGKWNATISRSNLGPTERISVPTLDSGADELRLEACKMADGVHAHAFQTSWYRQSPIEPRTLAVARLRFSLRPSPLMLDGECPCEAELPEAGLSCPLSSQQPKEGGRCYGRTDALCTYSCDGRMTLPTTVKMTRPPTAPEAPGHVTNPSEIWEMTLSRAGQVLDGHVPDSELKLSLTWKAWNRADPALWGDSIDTVILGAPDGRTFRVLPRARHVSVPALRVGDVFTLEFEGDRTFHVLTRAVEAGGQLDVPYPVQHVAAGRADDLMLALSGSGGLRYFHGAGGSTKWNPYGEVDVVATARALRNFGAARGSDFYVDPELRAGILFTTVPYASSFESSNFRDPIQWANVPVLMFPIDVALHAFGNQPFHFGIGLGALLSREMFASDSERVSNPLKASIVANAGLGVTRTFAIDLDFRFAGYAEYVERILDDAGLRQSSPRSTKIVFLGLRLRFDDVFEGKRVSYREGRSSHEDEASASAVQGHSADVPEEGAAPPLKASVRSEGPQPKAP